MNIFIVIPAYNEELSVGKVVSEIARVYPEFKIIVVDDGSSDLTGKVAREAGAMVLRHMVNRGQGAALKTGTDYALAKGADIIVHFDADGQFDTQDIRAMTEPILSGEYDAVLGSRFLSKESNIPFLRKIVLLAGKFFNKVFLGVKSSDPQIGLRALSKKAAESIAISHDDMAHCSEILEQLYKSNLKIREIPVVINYTEYSRKRGQSSLNAFAIAFKLILNKIFKNY